MFVTKNVTHHSKLVRCEWERSQLPFFKQVEVHLRNMYIHIHFVVKKVEFTTSEARSVPTIWSQYISNNATIAASAIFNLLSQS